MPTGFKAIQEAAERAESKRSTGTNIDFGPYHTRLTLPDNGSTAVVRFLEQGDEVYSYWEHNLSKQFGDGWRIKFPCLDQEDEGVPCPGCDLDLHRTQRGLFNVIWRDAPVYKTNDEGRFEKDAQGNKIQIGIEDQVAVWNQGIRVITMLAQKDVAYKGLSSRDFIVTRHGTKADNTTYTIEAADVDGGPQPLSDKDVELAKNKYDLKEIANFKTAEEIEQIIEQHLGSNDSSNTSSDVSSFTGINSTPFS